MLNTCLTPEDRVYEDIPEFNTNFQTLNLEGGEA